MKTLKTISVVSILTAVALVSCHPAISSFDASSSNEPSLVSSTISVSSSENSSSSSVLNSSSTTISSSNSQSSSSNKETSSSQQSSQSSVTSSSSNAISSSSTTSSSSSSSSVSSSSASSSQAPSSSSSVSSSISSSSSSSSSSSISSSVSSSSSSSSSSSQSSQSSSSSSSSSSSTPIEPVDPLANYETIDTFSMRMPAEFEPASMVKMCYPINMPLTVYKSIAETNKVLLLVNPDNSNKSRITKARSELVGGGVNVDNVTFIDMPIDSDYAYWVRDFSPFYVFKEKQLTITDFTYNRPRYEQNAVPSALAEYFNIPYNKMYLTHTGGNLMQDGRGTAFSDDLVIQENSNNRNKVITQMQRYTGTDNYVITIDPQGDYIAHIDCWGKIVAPDKIIVARLPETNSRYQYYEQVANQLANTKCVYGYNYRIYRVDEKGGNVVAPYTNSLIANNHVYLPLGSNATDNQNAIKVYQEALPGYEVIGLKGFSANDAYGRQFLNTDALHCRTHEVPDQNMIFIDSREVYHGEVDLKEHYVIKTNVVSYANEELDNVTIHYSINDSQYIEKPMNQYLETTNYTFVFEGLESGDEVKYYIDAKDAKDNYNIDPTCGALDPHHFIIK